jgi:polysaccharide pyruvyl transferase WcaK-like protein
MSRAAVHAAPLPILISGGFNCFNRGDWALCSAALESVRRCGLRNQTRVQMFLPLPEIPIEDEFQPAYVMSRWSRHVHRFGSCGSYRRYLRLQRRSIDRHLASVRRDFERHGADAPPILWFVGGGYMNDVASHGRFSTRVGLAAIDAGYRVVFTGQTIGPFRSPEFEQDVQRLLREAEWVGVRDEASLDRVQAMGGLKRPPRRTHDNVMDMLPQPISRQALQERVRDRLGVNLPSQWVLMTFHRQDSTDIEPDCIAIRETCDRLAKAGVAVVATSFWGYAHESDRRVVAALQSAGRNVTWVDHRVNTPELRALAAHAELMVSTRLHGLVFAFMAGVPGVCLYAGQYYRDKSFGLAHEWGQGPWSVDVATAYRTLPDVVERAWRDRDLMRHELEKHRDPRLHEIDPVFGLFQEWSAVGAATDTLAAAASS